MTTIPGAQETDARANHLSRALGLITAVANRDAAIEDITAQLRQEGYDALDVVVAALANASRQPTHNRRSQHPVDVRRFSEPSPRELVAEIVHRAPMVPFVLNGTLYDPADIKRFDGRELHFVAGDGGQLLAFDDREIIARTWELTFASRMPPNLAEREGRGQAGAQGVQKPSVLVDDMGPVPWPWWPTHGAPGTYFYEDSGYQNWGDDLHLRPHYGYSDLTRVSAGFLGSESWNDRISAYQCWGTYVVVLFEHVNYTGNTYTTTYGLSHKELTSIGWNDRASSIQTW
ncbi:MAG: hypothetical protein ACRDOY_01055 [Nocardioidaceae bacterium]